MSYTNPAIRATDLRKAYRVYKRPSERLVEWATLGRVRRHESFDALRGVSLEVPRGQCLGVVGRNGCGKSTLLKLLSGVLSPTGGSFDVRGRVFALIELGTGFNPHLTGSQNIDLASGLLGLDQSYVRQRKGQIIDFSELGVFIDRPMRTYSSGMRARLSFALYAFMEPDVLMIDEAFSVGDASFREKSYELIERMVSDESRTVVFVSHSIGAIKRLSQRVLWLEDGRVERVGDPEEITRAYLEETRKRRGVAPGAGNAAAPGENTVAAPEPNRCFYESDTELRRAWIEGAPSAAPDRAPAYDRFVLGGLFRAGCDGASHFWVEVFDESGVLVAQADTERLGVDATPHRSGVELVVRWPWRPLGVGPGRYRVRMGRRDAGEVEDGQRSNPGIDAGWIEVQGARVSDATYHVFLTPRVHQGVDGPS